VVASTGIVSKASELAVARRVKPLGLELTGIAGYGIITESGDVHEFRHL